MTINELVGLLFVLLGLIFIYRGYQMYKIQKEIERLEKEELEKK